MVSKLKKYIIPVLFLFLLCFTAVFYFVVPDKDISNDENRALAQFPDLTLENLSSGKFTAGINSYMSDQFPFRAPFIKLGDNISSVLELKKSSDGNDTQFIVNAGNTGGGTGERLNGNENEFEDKLDEDGYVTENTGNSVIIIDKGRAMEYYTFRYTDLQEYAATLNKFASSLDGVNVYSMLVPTASEFYLPDGLYDEAHSQKNAIDMVYSMTVPNVKRVDVLSGLSEITENSDNYIYYNTDHHWTAVGAYEGYEAFCEAANLDAVPLSEMTTARVEGDFFGSFCRLTKNEVLNNNPDYVDYYIPPTETEDVTAFVDADMTKPYDTELFVNPRDAQNKYMVFLGGDNPLVRIITKADSDKNLVIIKDSFGNALSPYFVSHYKNIYVLDPRTATTDIKKFCELHEIDDLIIETYAFSLSSNGISVLLNTLFE